MNAIDVEGLAKRFGKVAALDGVTLGFPQGTFTALLGPSGCGKTTLLRVLAGFEAPSAGRVLFDGRPVADATRQAPPESRGVGFVFQSYALWPHLDVAGNVAYPLQAGGVARASIAPRVEAALGAVGLAGYRGRRIEELSGGQRQRVALARCLVAETRVILFDEPLANLDIHLRAAMADMFREIHRRTGATVVYVTHDQAEALALADRIAVMRDGRVTQVAAPTEIYRAPVDLGIASFVGRGSVVDCVVERADGNTAVVRIGASVLTVRAGSARPGAGKLLLRPESLSLGGEGLEARVRDAVYRGPSYEIRAVLTDGGEVLLDSFEPLEAGAPVRISVRDAWLIPS